MDVEERHRVCELIEAMIGSDGVIHDAERAYLRRIVARFGLPARELGAVTESDVGRTTTTLRSLAVEDQPRVMALLVDVAVADGVVDPRERALLLAAGAALGIEATALEERIVWRLRANAPGFVGGYGEPPSGPRRGAEDA
jgi:uncharacterized tellurite resistance protein B-like protein